MKVDTMWLQLLVMLSVTTLCSCNCPPTMIRNTGPCSFYYQCYGSIDSNRLPDNCIEATNIPVQVNVTLTDVDENQDEESELLPYITKLRVTGPWRRPTFEILRETLQLETLFLINNDIREIQDKPFFYLNRLETLHLSHNKLKDIDFIFRFEYHPNKLRNLFLNNNELSDISKDAFEELTSLTYLDLSHNSIYNLNAEPFANLTQLETLKLNNNRIKDLNGAVNKLLNLRHLFLRNNQIQNIDDKSLDVIEHLEIFDISANDLETLKPLMLSRHWTHFTNYSICKIILSENHINRVPNAMDKKYLNRFVRTLNKHYVQTELDLSINSISNIEYNAFQSLIKLKSLNLSKNRLTNFSIDPTDLAFVKYLNLSGNYISELYFESFSSMNNLQELDLSGNSLYYVPDVTFNHNINLKHVNMTYNAIQKLDTIHIKMFHHTGGALDLSNNDIYKLKIPHGEGLRLIKLKLHSNKISDASLIDLTNLIDLKVLDMSNNSIETLTASSLLLPKNLTCLDLSHNQLTDISPSAFETLGNLQTLRLNFNNITYLDYGAFQGLHALYNLDLSFNEINYLDSKKLIELKSLEFLWLMSNKLRNMDIKSWYNRNTVLRIYVDNTNLRCEWLAKVLQDFINGYSKVKLTTIVPSVEKLSIEGIACDVNQKEPYIDISSDNNMADEMLLAITKKILDAVVEQNGYFRKLTKVLGSNPIMEHAIEDFSRESSNYVQKKH